MSASFSFGHGDRDEGAAEDPCVIVGDEEPAGAAFVASGCTSMLDFLSSPLLCNHGALQSVVLADEDESLRGLFSSVVLPRSLQFLSKAVRRREEAREAGSFARFLHALPTCLLPSCTELDISRVELISLDELAALCSAIGSPLCTVQNLKLDFTIKTSNSSPDLAPQTCNLVKDALFNNTSLHSLTFSTSDVCSPECLIPALTRTPSSISHLNLQVRRNDPHVLNGVSEILKGLAHNTISLRGLCISCSDSGNIILQPAEYIGIMLRTNTSLESLSLCDSQLPGHVVEMLFASLEKNAHLTSLSLYQCPHWPSASFVLDSLRVNGVLRYLPLEGTPLQGKNEAAIKAQLARNKQRAAEMKALQEEDSARVPPTTVRLFLCGVPYSGKTTLSRSLVRWNSGTSSSAKCLSCAGRSVPDRTRGIELSAIGNDKVKVSLWDMAGQAEYYAFHDHMFPNLSNDETPSLFLFVWNPIQVDESTGKKIKDEHGENMMKTLHDFEDEFRYWLRFIASKTLVSCKFRPKLLVAITRVDLLQINIRRWIKKSFKQCQEDFQEHIQLDMEGVFELDARDPYKVEDLALCIFESAELLLESRPLVYQACSRARLLICSKPLAPLITKQEFFFLCKKHLGLDSAEMHEAVALSLNESGDLIYFKSFDLVVVDLQWFCHYLMGNLLNFGKNTPHHEGFFSLEFLEDLLESRVNSTTVQGKQSCTAIRTLFSKATSTPRIKGEDLVKLLIGLQLACRRDDNDPNSDIFIPASLCRVPQNPIDPRAYLEGDDENILTVMGRRLKCKDSICTFFTPGIFTLLQIIFDNKFRGVHVTLEEDIIAFSHGGVKVLVEFCKHEGRDHFIDVLIHSRLDLDSTIGWAYEEILDKIENVCSQPRGIQGVQLVYEVIRPRSVREFVCMEQRLEAAVSIEELSRSLSNFLEKTGIHSDRLQTAFYDWHLTNDSDCVIDLLGKMETLKVIEEYKQKFILDVEDLLGIDVKQEAGREREPEIKVFRSTTSGTERKWIYDEIREARKDIQEVHEEIRKMADDVQKLGHSVLPKVVQKVEELLTFAKDNEMGKLPRLFVVTRNDAGLGRRLVSAIVPGLQNVWLELVCEHRTAAHLVAEQRGIRFATLEDGLLKQGLPYIKLFLRLASLAVKVGAAGAGVTIPDFSRLLAPIVDAPELPSLPTCLDSQAPGSSRINSRINFQESQQWLFEVLSKHNCCTSLRIHEVFGLNRVRYHDSHIGWLCDNHRSEGELCPII